jgi:uncharacterized surface protein with fasciclin (FAS1) repeats
MFFMKTAAPCYFRRAKSARWHRSCASSHRARVCRRSPSFTPANCLTDGAVALSLCMSSAEAADIVDTAVAAGSFKNLVTAIKAAGLVDTLKGPGPFTVFAPTDEAFAKLPVGTVEDLLKPENQDQLVEILTYHVVPGKVTSDSLVGRKTMMKTVEGSQVSIDATDGVRIDNAKVMKTDIEASIGLIHVIDTVIMPKM